MRVLTLKENYFMDNKSKKILDAINRVTEAVEKEKQIKKCLCGAVFRAKDQKHHNFFCLVAEEDASVQSMEATTKIVLSA